MDFTLNDDQRMLQDAVLRLVEREYRFEQRRGYAAEPDGFSRALWGQAAGIGLLGLAYSEADGGLGGSAVDVMLVMQALGRALPLDPFLPTMVLGAAALRGAGAADRGDGARRHRRARRGSRRRDGARARADRRAPEDARAVRRAAGAPAVPAASRRRDADGAGAVAQHGDVRGADARRARRG